MLMFSSYFLYMRIFQHYLLITIAMVDEQEFNVFKYSWFKYSGIATASLEMQIKMHTNS